MPCDGLFLHYLVDELKTKLEGGKIQKILEPSSMDLVFQIRSNKENFNLFASTSLDMPRLYISNLKHTSIDIPKNFCVILRKHIERGFIKSINQLRNDRAIIFDIEASTELGDIENYKLIIELMGRNSNIILINDKNIVIDAMRKVPPSEDTNRIILPKATYVYPENNGFLNPFELEDENVVIDRIEGLSKQIKISILESNSHILRYIKKTIVPTIYKKEKGYDYHVLPLIQYDIEKNDFENISSMLEYFYTTYKSVSTDKAKDLKKTIKNKITHFMNKLDNLNQDLEQAYENLKFNDYGIVLQANLYRIEKGKNFIELENFLSNNELIRIPLDPLLDPSKNLKKIFTKAKKAKNAIGQVNNQIDITKKEINYLDTIYNQIDFASSTDLDEIKDELIANKYLKQQKQTKPKKKSINITKYYLDGIEILVGKNNIQNDYITHKLARSIDWWFHVKDAPGSHVVFKVPSIDYKLTEKDIRYCANLAACFSKASKSSSVAVDYLQVKYIKKIPGTKGCEVTYTNQSTIYIDPDTNLLQQSYK